MCLSATQVLLKAAIAERELSPWWGPVPGRGPYALPCGGTQSSVLGLETSCPLAE